MSVSAKNAPSFTMDLNRSDGRYYAGEVVAGKVRLVTSKDIEARGIHITYRCVGDMKHVTQSDTMGTTYQGTKLYDEQRKTVFGSFYNPGGPIVESIVLPAGTVDVPFSFNVKADGPGSAEMQGNGWGSIRYSICAYIDLGKQNRSSERNHDDPSGERCLVILPLRPLPPPDLLRAIGYKGQPVIPPASCCSMPCFSKGEFSIEARLLRQAFAPGETLDFHLRVNNNTGRKLEVEVELVRSLLLQESGVNNHSFFHRMGRSMFTDTAEPHKVYEICHDPNDRNFNAVTDTTNHVVEKMDLIPKRKIVLSSNVPPSFSGAPDLCGAAGYDPVKFAYCVRFTASTTGWSSCSTSITIPVLISAAPPTAAALQAAHVANSGAPARQQATECDDPFYLQYNRDYVPEAVQNTPPVAHAVVVAPAAGI